MRKVFALLVCIQFLASCTQDSIVPEVEETNVEQTTLERKGDKIDVCHKGQIINVSINSLGGHQGHGDAIDIDGDGYFDKENGCSEVDCDDTDATVNPGATEVVYDGIDNDCNPETLDDDLDQDGFNVDVDCDDNNPDINPGMEEICDNGIDDNCNGEVDEDCCEPHPCLNEAISLGEAWLDNILDGNGSRISTTITSCSTFTVYFYVQDRNGRDACYVNYMEATGTPGDCGFTFSTHELVDCQ